MRSVNWFLLSFMVVGGCASVGTPIGPAPLSIAATPKTTNGPIWVNVDRAKLAQTIANYKGHLREAEAASEELLKQDPDNAVNWYAAAGLAAAKGNWWGADELIATGNGKPNAFDYQPTPYVVHAYSRLLEPLHVFGGLKDAPLDPQRKSKIAFGIRTMAARVADEQPSMEAAFYAAPALRLNADLVLKDMSAPQWRRFLSADNAYFGLVDKALSSSPFLSIALLSKRYSLPKVGNQIGPTTFDPEVAKRLKEASDLYQRQSDQVLRPILYKMPK